MDDAFRDYYQRRLAVHALRAERAEATFVETAEAEVGMPPPDPTAQEAVREALVTARETARRLGIELRPDAELLLLLLAEEIVAKPVAAVAPDQAPELPGVLRADVETLVANAQESANEGEVSAHAVVDSLSRSWDQLESARFRFWDSSGAAGPATPRLQPLDPSGELDLGPGEAPA